MAKRKVAQQPEPQSWRQRLLAIRAKLGNVTQAEAAAQLGVSERSWIHWELGDRVPLPIIQRAIEQFERKIGITS